MPDRAGPARTRVAGFVRRRAGRRRRCINLDATRHPLVSRPTNPTTAPGAGTADCLHCQPRSIQLTSEIFRRQRATEFFGAIRHFSRLPTQQTCWVIVVGRSSDDVKRCGARREITRLITRVVDCARAAAASDSVRSVIYRASCHRVAAGCRVPVGVVRYLVAATAWNLRLHSFGVSPQSPLAGSQQSIGPGVLTL